MIAETDSEELVSLWRSRGTDMSEIATILCDVQELAFSSFVIVHVRRTANAAC